MARVTTLIYKATGRRPRSSGSGVPTTPGTTTIAPPLMGDTNAVYAPSVVADGLIVAPFLDNAQSFYGPIVSAAAVFISPPKLASAEVIFPPTLNQTIYLPLHTNAQTFYDAQVLNAQAIVAPLLSDGDTFYGPTVNQSVTAPLLTNSPVLYAPTIVTGTSILPTLLDNSQSFYGPQLNLKVSPALVSNSQTFYGPSVASGYIIRPTAFASGQAFYPPQVNLSLTSGWVNNANAFYGPIVSSNALIVAPFLNAGNTVYAPALSRNVKPPLLTNSNTFYPPAVVLDTSQVVNAPYHLNSQVFYGPRLNLNVRPALFTNTSVIRAPSVSLASTPGFALSTPVVTLTTAAGAIPEVDITMGADIYAGFYLRIQRSATGSKNVSDGSYVSSTVNIAHQITADEIHEDVLAITSANLASDGYTNPSGTYYQQYRWEREDGAISAWSNEITGAVTVASTALYTATGFNKKQYVSVTGDPALVATGTSGVGAPQPVRCTAAKTGKKQLEVTLTTLADNYVFICIEDGTTDLNSGFIAPGINNSAGFGLRISSTGFGLFKAGVSVASGSTAGASGDVLTATFDTSAGTASFYRTRSGSTVLIGTITGISQATYQACIGPYSGSVLTANFGQSAFTRAFDTGYAMYG